MLHLNTAPAEPPRRALPCLRDLADLTRDHLPEMLIKLVPLPELERRAAELALTHPRFQEELPVVVGFEARRRGLLLRGGLRVPGRRLEVGEGNQSSSLQA